MAILDAYADAEQYRASNNRSSGAEDTELDDALALSSRRLEKLLQLAPGAFNSHTATYLFDGTGTNTLRLRDSSGLGYFLQSIDADSLAIDNDRDGSFDDYAWDLADAWLEGGPVNAATQSEPYRWLRLLPITSAPTTIFPATAHSNVQITGTWGWAAVPTATREVTIALTRDLLDGQLAGPTQILRGPDGEEFEVAADTFGRFMGLARLYGRRRPLAMAV